MARAGRRAQAEEALAFERDREAELRRQLADVVLEEEGARVDAAAVAELEEDDVRRVRAALGELDDGGGDDEDDLFDEAFVTIDFGDEPEREGEDDEAETSRLEREIAESLRTQAALERFIAALDAPAPTEMR